MRYSTRDIHENDRVALKSIVMKYGIDIDS